MKRRNRESGREREIVRKRNIEKEREKGSEREKEREIEKVVGGNKQKGVWTDGCIHESTVLPDGVENFGMRPK